MNTSKPAIPDRLRPERAVLLVIDIQERLYAVMAEEWRRQMTRNTQILARGAQALGVPILLTEQYPKGLGPTVAAVREALPPDQAALTKIEFSSAKVVADALGGPRQVILCGMETHVCVYQTARDLRQAGHDVYVARDAVISRSSANWEAGLGLMASAGAVIGSTEAALFDLCERAGTPAFKAISALVK